LTGILWTLGIAVVLGLLLCLRIQLCASCGESGVLLRLKLGFLSMTLYDAGNRQKPEIKTNRKKKRQKAQEKDTEEAKRPGSVRNYRELLPIIRQLLGKLRTRLSIDELTFWYLSAGEDPAKAALAFGAANAAAGLLLQPLETMFRIKKRDVRTAVSFEESKPKIYVCLRLSVSVGTLLRLLLRFHRQSRSREKSRIAQDDTEE